MPHLSLLVKYFFSIKHVGQQDGQIERIQTVAAKVEIPRNIGVDPEGRWLLVAGQKSGNVPVFQIRIDGTLKETDNEVSVANAMCVEFLKTGE